MINGSQQDNNPQNLYPWTHEQHRQFNHMMLYMPATVLLMHGVDIESPEQIKFALTDPDTDINVLHTFAYDDMEPNTPLTFAAKYGKAKAAAALIRLGADIDKGIEQHKYQTPLELAISEENNEVVKVLLMAGAKLESTESRDNGNFNAFEQAIQERNTEALFLILNLRQIDLNAKNHLGKTGIDIFSDFYKYFSYPQDPSTYSFEPDERIKKTLSLLLEHGARVTDLDASEVNRFCSAYGMVRKWMKEEQEKYDAKMNGENGFPTFKCCLSHLKQGIEMGRFLSGQNNELASFQNGLVHLEQNIFMPEASIKIVSEMTAENTAHQEWIKRGIKHGLDQRANTQTQLANVQHADAENGVDSAALENAQGTDVANVSDLVAQAIELAVSPITHDRNRQRNAVQLTLEDGKPYSDNLTDRRPKQN